MQNPVVIFVVAIDLVAIVYIVYCAIVPVIKEGPCDNSLKQ